MEIKNPSAPRTRGSTLLIDQRVEIVPVCPAHAGIDPYLSGVYDNTSGLPRARGDRPLAVLRVNAQA